MRYETGTYPTVQPDEVPAPAEAPVPEPAAERVEPASEARLLDAADRALGALDRELAEVDAANVAADNIGTRLQAEVDRLSDIERELEQLSAVKGPGEED